MKSFLLINYSHLPVTFTNNNIQPRHTAGLFLKLLTPVKTPVYLTLLNNPFPTTSFPINYKTMILLSVKPAFSPLNKTQNIKTPRLNKEGTFYRKPLGCYVKSGRSHSRKTPFCFFTFSFCFCTHNLNHFVTTP